MTKGTVEKNNVIPNLKHTIDGTRAQGIPVLFGPMAYVVANLCGESTGRAS